MRKRIVSLLCLMWPTLSLAAEPVAFDWFEYTGRDAAFEQPLAAGQYRNPILPGFYPDPSICRVGDDYYLINSTFAYFPGIPIFHSRDLVNWTQLGHVIDRASQLDYDGLGVSRGIFAPAISHHDGTFYVVCTMVDAGGNFFVTAKNPAGPWSDPVWLHEVDGIDPSFFFDENTGRAWLVNNGPPPDNKPLYSGHRAIWIQEVDVAAQKLTGPRSIIVNGGVDLAQKPVWVEGPHLYRRGDWYYLCCAEGGTGDNHSQVIFRSRVPTGPFEPWSGNPILTQRGLDPTLSGAVTCTGHADLEIGPDGNSWAVFLGCRPYGGKWYATGRETFLLPVTWTDNGWPVILPPGQRVPYTAAAPRAGPVAGLVEAGPNPGSPTPATAQAPLNGNFTWRDDFPGAELSLLWIMLRTPRETWWSLDPSASTVRLTPRAENLSGKANPSYLARRVQHARFDASTALAIPAASGVSAGLVAFQSEKHHYFLGVQRNASGLRIFLEKAAGSAPTVVATADVPAAGGIALWLSGDDARGVFSYATKPGEWRTLVSDADMTVLTTQAAGGFVGATVGVHARLEPTSGAVD
jgi:xylan 1,4-beta-xylosidase